jgi:lipid A ethanolaminephosphotransferase
MVATKRLEFRVAMRGPLRLEVANFCLAAYFVAVLNIAFWRQFFVTVAPASVYEFLFVGATIIIAFCLLVLFFGLFALPGVFKLVMTLLLLLSAAAAYFMNEYGVVIDVDMVRNVFLTNRAEAGDLITFKLVFYVLVLGGLPALLLWACTIVYRPIWKEFLFRTKAVAALIAIVVVVAFPFAQNLTSVFREQRILQHVFTPLNYLSALIDYARPPLRSSAMASMPFGEDAHKSRAWLGRPGRSLTILVIGETARAANFALAGYERDTNPLLSKVPGLISFTKVLSCGTATAQSLPCMFSGLGRTGKSGPRNTRKDGLLQILQRAGFSVLWRENQGGCAGVCGGIQTEILEGAGTRALFELGESRDENLVKGLQDKIDSMDGHAVVVLHMMGSHGPAYYKRYPAEFERFQPACKESQFSRCQRSEIINSYDNTIVYTDHVLSRVIEFLQFNDSRGLPSAMVYLSDHGESLGESNIYLHGLPYAFAPDVQKHVPMLLWVSPKMQVDFQIDTACLEHRRHEALSHDNFFHSVLGLLDVETQVYTRDLDIFARCRTGRVAAPAQ